MVLSLFIYKYSSGFKDSFHFSRIFANNLVFVGSFYFCNYVVIVLESIETNMATGQFASISIIRLSD